LEFGVVLHSILIGLTLAVDEDFIVLFVVLIFHRQSPSPLPLSPALLIGVVETFEGLGIGSRLALLNLGERHQWVPVAGAIVYGFTTPIGIAAGLGVRTTYNPGSATASVVSGVMDATSAGILIYASLVEVRAFHSGTRIETIS
jgi:zinc transporter 1/2/3